jgi:hypothetical protein
VRYAGRLAAAAALTVWLLAGSAAAGDTAASSARTPTLRVVVPDTVAEGDAVRIAVVLDAAAGHAVSVRVDTREGTADAWADYRPVHRRVTVPAGATVVRVPLVARADGLDEGPEDLAVRIGGASGGSVAHRRSQVTIRDRDPLPRARVVEARFSEPTSGHRLGFTEVRLSAPSGRRVVVEMATRSGTATAGLDFVALHPMAMFAPGVTRRPVSVEILADDRVEPPETVRIVITGVTHALATRPTRVTILDAPGGRVAGYSRANGP